MKIKPGKEKEYQDWYKENEDHPYSKACFIYAEKWADLLEKEIEKTKKSSKDIIEERADKLSHDADEEGITGFMYGMAVGILSESWIHGEELRCWHNLKTQIHNEGEEANKKGGVLNPAMLNIGTK